MSIRLNLGGKKLDLVFELVEAPLIGAKSPTSLPQTHLVVLKKEKGQYLYHALISADLSNNPDCAVLQPGEFYLRDYNQRELVDVLVEEGWLEPVVDYSPVKSGYVNFWVYRLSARGLEQTLTVAK